MLQDKGHAVADDLAADPEVRRGTLMRRDGFESRSLAPVRDSQIRRAPGSSGLYEVLDLILDKGIVVDAFVRVSLVGIELLTVDLRVVIASVDTYLRYAEGIERLQVTERSGAKKLPDVVGGGAKKAALAKGASTIGKKIAGGGGKDDDDEDENDEGATSKLAHGVRNVVSKGVNRLFGGGGEDDDDAGDEQRSERGDRGRKRDEDSDSGKGEQRRHNGSHGKAKARR